MSEFEKVDKFPHGLKHGMWIGPLRAMAFGEVLRIEGDEKLRRVLFNCARSGGIKIRTSVQDGYIYVERLA